MADTPRMRMRLPDLRPQLLGATIIGAVTAAVAYVVAWHLAPGTFCPAPPSPDHAQLVQGTFSRCLELGGSAGHGSNLTYAALTFAITAVVALYYLLLARAWRTSRARQGGWSPCATS